jgi:hypothetical protein
MSDIALTRINDVIYGANSLAWLIDDAPYVGIQAFDYSEKRDRKLVYGGRRDGTPLGMADGQYSVDALSMTMLLASFDILTTSLSAKGGGSYGDARFPINVSISDYQAQLQNVLPVSIDIVGARISGVKAGRATENNEQTVDVTMMALSLTRNGKRLWSLQNGLGQ